MTGCGLIRSSAPWGSDRKGLPACLVTVEFIESEFEAHLLYPGSTVIGGTSGNGQTHDLLRRTSPAVLDTFAATSAAVPTIHAW